MLHCMACAAAIICGRPQPVETLELADASNVGFVSFSPSGRDLAAGDWRGVACVWRLSHALHETWARDDSDAIHHFGVAPDATKP